MQGLFSLYSWRYPLYLLHLWKRHGQTASGYIKAYWRTTDFRRLAGPAEAQLTARARERFIVLVLYIGMGLQIVLGLSLVALWHTDDLPGGLQFGLAVLLFYPLLWAHLLVVIAGCWWLVHPKALGKAVLCALLSAQVRRLRRRHEFSIVAVAGSVGKTSTKMAIARVLQASRRVLWQEGNYNDPVTVPLIFFDKSEPGIFNVWAWLKIIVQNEAAIRHPYPYQVVVVELGTDAPGFIQQFAYLKPELVIITAVTPEHMEYFETLDAVAQEELGALHFAKRALVNIDDTPAKYLADRNFTSYGLQPNAIYHASKRKPAGMRGQTMYFQLGEQESFELSVPLLGEQGAKVAVAAAAAAAILGIPLEDIKKGVATVTAFAGRMQILNGIMNTTIIDDTYNSSPAAAKAALDVLQGGEAPQRIAILGSMNELGAYSPEAHREVGEHCDPSKLDWVITIGPDAKEYLAPIAKKRGCQVKTFLDPYKAGRFVKTHLREGAVILAKGSQNRVFAEESLKVLLADPQDESKLVRQSAYWTNLKKKQFTA
jgi:UDP-N-acetylmuramoyl-tripeptide--D-alanyl-D-alanine ligase